MRWSRLGVVAAALAIRFTGWLWLDPLASLAIVVMIVAGTWGVLRESIDLAMDAVPAGVSHDAVQDWLAGLPGVIEVHDLHIWALSTTETALTAHLVYAGEREAGRLHDVSMNWPGASASATRRCRSRAMRTPRCAGCGRTMWCEGKT